MPKCPFCQNTIDVTLIKSLSGEDIQAMIRAVDDTQLEGDAANFISDLKGRVERYGDRTKVTQPQRKWLTDLAKKYPVKLPEAERSISEKVRLLRDTAYAPPLAVVITDDDIPF